MRQKEFRALLDSIDQLTGRQREALLDALDLGDKAALRGLIEG